MTDEHAVIKRTFEPADLAPLLERVGVDRTVLVQSACSDLGHRLHVRACGPALVDRRGDRLARSPITRPSRSPTRATPGRAEAEGFRHLIHNEPDPHWILEATVRASLASLEETGMILELPCVFPRHLGDVPELAARFPGLTIVIDHLAKPPLRGHEMGAWAAALHAAAPAQRLCEDLRPEHDARSRRLGGATISADAVAVAFEAFGPERLVCGSDWPVALLNGDYEKVWRETIRVVRDVAPDSAEATPGGECTASLPAGRHHRHGRKGRVMAALTDQAIAEIRT